MIYGSFVENKMTVKSDIDLAVEFSKITLKEVRLALAFNSCRKSVIAWLHEA